ncbi:MAB_1171c family putative transporter [Cryobacterium zhongshanensis]|uniref:DUF6545 domain-containing protein n=1 Tax=Cryobacterium zhongshanensis TaxID=2928153 RepID=A0AA41QVL6_9MICO|nr:MAB_1171c family putative transporter [Cryobacterium zhongshanensis]MCI4658110.1 hypothetical protein [Cryobacterium zhongshanensis]
MVVIVQVIVCSLLWIATLVCLPSAFRGRRRLLFWLLATFAVLMTLQPDPVYAVIDSAIGGVNVTYFVLHAVAIVAVALVNSLVQAAASPDGITRRQAKVTGSVTVAVIVVQAVLFFGADWRITDDIHHSFFDRWDYTIYASTTWVVFAYFSVSVALACLADMRRQRRTLTRVSLGFVALGCLGVLIWALVSITNATMTVMHHDSDFTNWSRPLYFTTLLLSPLCMVVGLGLTAAVDGTLTVQRRVRDRVLLWRLSPLWERLLASSPELSMDASVPRIRLVLSRDPAARLYRRYVEIRDSLLLYPQHISRSEQVLLTATERQTHPEMAGEHTV